MSLEAELLETRRMLRRLAHSQVGVWTFLGFWFPVVIMRPFWDRDWMAVGGMVVVAAISSIAVARVASSLFRLPLRREQPVDEGVWKDTETSRA